MRADDRRRHLKAVGKTGTGKSTLLLNLIADDVQHDTERAASAAPNSVQRNVCAISSLVPGSLIGDIAQPERRFGHFLIRLTRDAAWRSIVSWPTAASRRAARLNVVRQQQPGG